MEPPAFLIRAATAADAPVLLRMIEALVDHEQLAREFVATEEALLDSFFGPLPAAEAVLGCVGRDPVAYAVFYRILPTAIGRPSLYLEDLFVRPAWRRHGFGRRLLAHVAAVALSRGCARLEWSVFDWNEAAIKFYRSVGAELEPRDASSVYRLGATELRRLAAGA
jgi:GNAT superfamily N-acetyltransferase